MGTSGLVGSSSSWSTSSRAASSRCRCARCTPAQPQQKSTARRSTPVLRLGGLPGHACTAPHRFPPHPSAGSHSSPRPSPACTRSRPLAHPGAIDARRRAAGAAAKAPLIPYVDIGLGRAVYGIRWPRGRRHLDPSPLAAVRRCASNPRPSRPRTAPAPAPCVARTSVGLRLTQASLHAVVAGARRRIDPCCPRVQVARGGQMEPLKGSWRAPPAQLAAPARPQARPRLLVPGTHSVWLVGPCLGRCTGFCAYSPCGVCVRLMSRSSSLVVYCACRCVQSHGK